MLTMLSHNATAIVKPIKYGKSFIKFAIGANTSDFVLISIIVHLESR
jgi:hypothetical protein